MNFLLVVVCSSLPRLETKKNSPAVGERFNHSKAQSSVPEYLVAWPTIQYPLLQVEKSGMESFPSSSIDNIMAIYWSYLLHENLPYEFLCLLLFSSWQKLVLGSRCSQIHSQQWLSPPKSCVACMSNDDLSRSCGTSKSYHRSHIMCGSSGVI